MGLELEDSETVPHAICGRGGGGRELSLIPGQCGVCVDLEGQLGPGSIILGLSLGWGEQKKPPPLRSHTVRYIVWLSWEEKRECLGMKTFHVQVWLFNFCQ